jgi:hypothetical protein
MHPDVIEDLKERLIDIAMCDPRFVAALRAVRSLDLGDWCIGAGAVRNLVWDKLHGKSAPSQLNDVDVAYFDANDFSRERDVALQARLAAIEPAVPWEVTNQAGVHLWFEDLFGHPVAPLRSLDEAVASWPEFATAVGITLDAEDTMRVIAPHGLDDLFAMLVRRNPRRVSIETYRHRVATKRYAERWSQVRVMPC